MSEQRGDQVKLGDRLRTCVYRWINAATKDSVLSVLDCGVDVDSIFEVDRAIAPITAISVTAEVDRVSNPLLRGHCPVFEPLYESCCADLAGVFQSVELITITQHELPWRRVMCFAVLAQCLTVSI